MTDTKAACKSCRFYIPSVLKDKGICGLTWDYIETDEDCEEYERNTIS